LFIGLHTIRQANGDEGGLWMVCFQSIDRQLAELAGHHRVDAAADAEDQALTSGREQGPLQKPDTLADFHWPVALCRRLDGPITEDIGSGFHRCLLHEDTPSFTLNRAFRLAR